MVSAKLSPKRRIDWKIIPRNTNSSTRGETTHSCRAVRASRAGFCGMAMLVCGSRLTDSSSEVSRLELASPMTLTPSATQQLSAPKPGEKRRSGKAVRRGTRHSSTKTKKGMVRQMTEESRLAIRMTEEEAMTWLP